MKDVKRLRRPLIIASIAALLVLVDFFVAPFFVKNASFTWISFISWTIFSGSKNIDRLKGIFGVVIGFVLAYLLENVKNISQTFIPKYFFLLTIISMIIVFIENLFVIYLGQSKIFFNSVSGMFLGIALSFSGIGIGLQVSNPLVFKVIMVYTIIGILCAIAAENFSKSYNQ